MTRRAETDLGGVQLAEEAFALLRRAPVAAWLAYYTGALPFALGFLYFWADMSRGAFAATRCAGAAFGLAILFVWMKSWQALFCAQLRSVVAAQPDAPWTPRRLARVVCLQAAVQPLGLIIIPISLLLMLPFAWVYAYYQNISVYGAAADADAMPLRRRAWEMASLWPIQNHLMVWLLSPWLTLATTLAAFGLGWLMVAMMGTFGHVGPFTRYIIGLIAVVLGLWPCSPLGFVVAANAAVAVMGIPYLLHRVLGYETVFVLSGWHAVTNTTFLAIVGSAVWLCMDPLVKAAYVLRCFHGESIRSGADLRADLRAARPARLAALIAIALLAGGGHARGAEGAAPRADAAPAALVAADALGDSIAQVLERDEFRWRLPRINPQNAPAADSPQGWWAAFLQEVGARVRGWMEDLKDAIDRLMAWLDKLLKKRWNDRPAAEAAEWGEGTQVVLYALTALVVCILTLVLLRLRRQRQAPAPAPAEARPAIDLTQEDVAADRLAADEWTRLAAELLQRGEYRLALRALFLSALAHLAQGEIVRLAAGKSNRDYLRDLRRRAQRHPDVIAAFAESVREFDRVWYGRHPATAELVAGFGERVARITSYALTT